MILRLETGKCLQQLGFLEKADAENLRNGVQAVLQPQLFFDHRQQQVDGDGRPDLRFHGVLGQAVEPFDAQMLFDLFEEQLDLPTTFVELRDGQSREQKIVGQKGETFFGLGIDIADTPQLIGVAMCGNKTFQPNSLIAAQSGGGIDRTRRDAVEGEIFPGANDEKSQALRRRVPLQPFA